MARTLTAANAIISISITGLFPIPQQIKGFSADNVYDTQPQDVNETMMGVDGVLSAGFIFSPVDQVFRLQANSLSNDFFEAWKAGMVQAQDTYFADGTTTLPSLGKTYVMSHGVLVNLPALPTLNKVAQPRAYTIRWQSVQPIPLAA